jgi:hypothetical protein
VADTFRHALPIEYLVAGDHHERDEGGRYNHGELERPEARGRVDVELDADPEAALVTLGGV